MTGVTSAAITDAMRTLSPVCRWFAKCSNPAPQQVEHPSLGWVNICDAHLAWLGPHPSPTQFVPPLAAAVLDRNPAARAIILGEAEPAGQVTRL